MAKLAKIVRRNPVSVFQQTAPVAGAGFSLLAQGMQAIYDRAAPAAIEGMKRQGLEEGRQAAKDQFEVPSAGHEHASTQGSAPVAGAGLIPGLANINFGAIGIRKKPLAGNVINGIDQAVKQLGPGIDVRITSAGQPGKGEGGKRTGSTRHDHGNAADLVLIRDGKEVTPNQDPALYERFFEAAGPNFTGLGHYDWGVHVGGGTEAFWGPDTTSATADERFASAVRRGRKGLMSKDTNGRLSTQGSGLPTVSARMSNGKLESRMFSPYSGPILQAYNAAATVAYQSEVLNQSTEDMMQISHEFPLNPEGFEQAAQGYVDQIVENAPASQKAVIRASLEQEAQRRKIGLMTEKHRDIEQRANNSSAALVDRYSDEYAQAIASGDQEQIDASLSRLDDILQAREAIPGVSWTEEQSANQIIKSRKAGDRLIASGLSEAKKGACKTLKLIRDAAKDGRAAEDESILRDAGQMALCPESASEAQAFVQLRDSLPEFLKMAPDEMDVALAKMRATPVAEDHQIDILKAAETVAKDNRKAWDEDPVKRAAKVLDTPPPKLPDLTTQDPDAFFTAMADRVKFMDEEVFARGFTGTRAYLSEKEAEEFGVILSKQTPPEIRAAFSAAIVQGAGPAAIRIFDEVDADRLTQFSGKMMAVGANPAIASEMMRGQLLLEEGVVKAPTEAAVRDTLNADFSEAFVGLPDDINARSDVMTAARAIYAARVGGAELTEGDQEDLMNQSINAALGGGKNKALEKTGGVQDVLGSKTLLPVGISGVRADQAVRRALGGLPHGSGFIEGLANIGAGLFDPESFEPVGPEVWNKASRQDGPLYLGESIPTRLIENGNIRIVAAGTQGYRMEVNINGVITDVEDSSENVYFFDLEALMEAVR